ncbi:hypothetical protein CPJCM30710_32520 [Clostridium polyendosporum]|uniref:Uncharacterized protein n=1 Tax=Clostridium polyendosporum TaxID=69208 RepID=A0A919VIB8_9CLOT|nr:hypothetical protein [Clostridium polyendosporum]GIM30586.1 hypothetical protein CPJCM30710_32520 [Clostridium polyendosporum]
MPKDSQVDDKLTRKLKANWDTTLADEEAKNRTRTTKKQSAPRNVGQ